jgi:hypothetical protein
MALKTLTDDDIELLRKANVPVPESLEELDHLVEAAERDPRELPLSEAFKEIRRRVAARIEKSKRG